jgi:3-keto-L-gulonate-6-phosphate decarboxylase
MHVIEMELHDIGRLTTPAFAAAAKIASVRIAEFETPEAAEKAIEEINHNTYVEMLSLGRMEAALRKFYGPDKYIAVVFTKRPL